MAMWEQSVAASSISRRLEASISALQREDYETALIHYFPALDKTAKRRRPKAGVGDRIRGLIDDELEIISHIATQNIFRITCDGVSFPDAIYKFGRTSIAHEGELDPRLRFDNTSGMSIGEIWNLPPTFIASLIVAVVVAPENDGETFSQEYAVNIHGKQFHLNRMWGDRQGIRTWMEAIYGRPLFDRTP